MVKHSRFQIALNTIGSHTSKNLEELAKKNCAYKMHPIVHEHVHYESGYIILGYRSLELFFFCSMMGRTLPKGAKPNETC
jgi:hypothetical protein